MPRIDARRATALAVIVACLVYANSLLNGWAGDDVLVVRDNERVHSALSALRAWFLPYWPPPWQGAGLYRPLTILSYGVEWSLGGGRLWVFHLTNVLLHALATGLVVRIALQWLAPAGALVAGVFFALHPVHVEAVSNVVGRAELLAAAGLLAAVLAARQFRHAADDRSARRWFMGTVVFLLLALLSKEHAIIAVAMIAVDHALDPELSRRDTLPLYLGVTAATLAWFHVWHSIAGLYVSGGATTAFYGMTTAERWATMLPVQLDVLRLLAFPMDLTGDYSQQTITIRTTWTIFAALGLVAMGAVLLLGLATIRRAPAVAFGILIALGSYAPTSNFFFTSGVVLAERALYLAVLAPALALGWLALWSREREYHRLLLVALGVAGLAFSIRVWTRTPYWRTPQTSIIEDAGDHPENYRARMHLAGLFASKRDTARALAEYLAAETLAERDPFLGLFIVNTAVAMKRYDVAIAHARRAQELAPGESRTSRWLVQAQLAAGQADSAVATALESVLSDPHSEERARTYAEALEEERASRARIWLARAHSDWLAGHAVEAAARIDSARTRPAGLLCEDLEAARKVLDALDSSFVTAVRAGASGPCAVPAQPASNLMTSNR